MQQKRLFTKCKQKYDSVTFLDKSKTCNRNLISFKRNNLTSISFIIVYWGLSRLRMMKAILRQIPCVYKLYTVILIRVKEGKDQVASRMLQGTPVTAIRYRRTFYWITSPILANAFCCFFDKSRSASLLLLKISYVKFHTKT